MKRIVLFIVSLVYGVYGHSQTTTDLIGYTLNTNPGFLIQRSFNFGDPIYVSVDPTQYSIDGVTARIYITENRTTEEWTSDPWITDVRPSGYEVVTLSGDNLAEVAVELSELSFLSTYSNDRPGRGFDVIIDLNQDGILSDEDFIDGLEDDRPGFYLLPNLNDIGPYEVDTAFYSTAEFRTFKLFYPSGIASMTEQPLVVISHGWTHEYWYYDFLGEFLASYGYVVMSHRNDVGNGNGAATNTASICALENIHELLANESTVANGVLNGKINNHLIVHTGHSTGGECVVRAYKRLVDNEFVSEYFDESDIVLVSSIAPVAFLNGLESNSMMANYHIFCGGADTDAEGFPSNSYKQTLSLYERARGNKQVTYIHGAGHEDFHGFDSENPLAAGPNLIGKEAVHTVMKPYFLALCELYARNSLGMKDYFIRNKAEFRPLGIADEITVSGEYQEKTSLDISMIDDFQTNENTELASSGTVVTNDLSSINEVLMSDLNGSFEWDGTQTSNGFCRARFDDDPKCAVIEWNNENDFWNFEMTNNLSNWSEYEYLQFRACQMSRHPNNLALNDDIYFSVKIEDANGNEAMLSSEISGPIRKIYPKSNGGYGTLCLPEGQYTVNAGGSSFNSEINFEIPGYLAEGVGSWILEVGPGDPCTELEFFMYDTFGDGWDNGNLQVFDSEGTLLETFYMYAGFEPDLGEGWQNEFWNVRFRLDDFQVGATNVDLSQIANLTFLFGPDYGSPLGALGVDDIHLLKDNLSYMASQTELETTKSGLLIYPNPTAGNFILEGDDLIPGDVVSVFNSQGKLIYQEKYSVNKIFALDHTSSSGLYHIQVESNSGVLSTTFVVVK
jgi:hypothetical protein